MTQVLRSPPHLPSSPSTTSISCVSPKPNDGLNQQHPHTLFNDSNVQDSEVVVEEEGGEGERRERRESDREGDELSLLELLVAAFRKSLVSCRTEKGEDFCAMDMEISWPTNVRHVAHVTFDRFNGFLGLPVEFEPEVPRRAPSASAKVFGVSTESMQLSFDCRGNSVPTILLLMQRCLYAQGGLQAEGIFRINAENSQEEFVRDQLNRGVVPDGIDVHCLAGLIKAWFRELPNGILDALPPERVMQSQSEEECAELVTLLPPTEAALLDWAINLMADVAQFEHLNKMNARNVAMVFAPNMTQMSDPLTALMYAVQVMNFLKTLIVKTLREREDSIIESVPLSRIEPSDPNGPHSCSQPFLKETNYEENEDDKVFTRVPSHPSLDPKEEENEAESFLTPIENIISGGNGSLIENRPHEIPARVPTLRSRLEEADFHSQNGLYKVRNGQSSSSNLNKGARKSIEQPGCGVNKSRRTRIATHLDSRTQRVEAWR